MTGSCTYKDMAETLDVNSFYDVRHQYIWRSMKEIAASGEHDFICPYVIERFSRHLALTGGYDYMCKLETIGLTPAPRYYARMVKDAELRRELYFAVEGSLHDIGLSTSYQKSVQEIQTALQDLHDPPQEERTFKLMLRDTMTYVEECYRGEIPSFEIGVEPLDEVLIVRAPDNVIIAGRPGTGKTALAIQTTEHNAEMGMNVGVISGEMVYRELCLRMIARRSGVPTDRMLKKGGLQGSDFERITNAIVSLSSLPIHIDDTTGIRINEVEARARHWKRKYDINVLIVDYLQKIRGEQGKRYDSREQEVADIASRLKEIGKELNIATIVLAQLGRSLEKRATKENPFPKPNMSDLRESGQIEQEANTIIFLWCDEESYEALVRKQRQGKAPVDVPMHFDKPRQTFSGVDEKSNFAGAY